MDMLSNYLYAVHRYLPKDAARDDIVAEIGEALQSQIEERERSLGRPLNADEEAALIKAYGHPRLVASRYGKHQALIGPDLLPFYWPVLICVLSIVVVLDLFIAAVAAIKTGDVRRFWDGAGIAWDAFWIYAAVITAVFALIERVPGAGAKCAAWISRWDPRRLPAAGSIQVPRSASFFEALGSAGMLVLLVDQGWARHLVLFMLYGPVGLALPNVTFSAAWLPLYAIVIGATAILLPVNLVTLILPLLRRLRDVAHLAVNGALAAGCALALRGGALFPADPRLNQIAVAALAIGIVAFVCAVAFNVRALLRHSRMPALAPAAWEKPTY
ncbi:MAG TPA: hypothetical protein VMF11_15005 [Candidatus Baltobacteraceae bacterium]|nr:hypothetical protein [Candidatus Baltobacteraceae bacterium]